VTKITLSELTTPIFQLRKQFLTENVTRNPRAIATNSARCCNQLE